LSVSIVQAASQSSMAQSPAPSQPTPAPAPAAAPAPAGTVPLADAAFEIDIVALIKNLDTLDQTATDGIWEIKPAPGKRLLQLPLILSPGKSKTQLDSSTIKIRGGRFLVFKMADVTEKAPKGSDAARAIEASIPDGAPRITRKLILTPDSTVQWS